MATTGENAAILDGVRRIFDGGTAASLSAEALLRRFATRGDEAAFEAIVARHGPMVLGVCRRQLADRHDVEDAFQATFLVLVKKADSIRDGEGLGPWLHGVARRVATRARANGMRRRATERSGLAIDPAAPGADPDRDEIRAVVDEEIGRLPERYRRLVVLCDLEGHTQGEAARRLETTEGTVRGRLAKARGLLRSRLVRRGVVVPSGLIAGLSAPDPASAARLGPAFLQAAIRAATGAATAGVEEVSTTAVALAKEVLRAMTHQKLFTTALSTLVAALALSGAGVAVVRGQKADDRDPFRPSQPARNQPTARAQPPDDPFSRPDTKQAQAPKTKPRRPDDPFPEEPGTPPADPGKAPEPEPEPAGTRKVAIGDRLVIEVLEALPGRVIRGERLVRPDGTVSLGFYGDLKVVGLTRREVKVELVEHLRDWLTDQTLGLMNLDQHVRIHPALSNRVYVDDSLTFETRPQGGVGASRVVPENSPAAPIRTTQAGKPKGDPTPSNPAKKPEPPTIQPGDQLVIEALQALPARPIKGIRAVRPDGTVGLGFYGDVKLAGLTRAEAKVKVIEHLRQWISDEALGLVATTDDGQRRSIPPERSTFLYVNEAVYEAVEAPNPAVEARIDALEGKLDRILETLEGLKKGRDK